MRALFCGSRNWDDETAIYDTMCLLQPLSCVISGGARGADTLAYRAAESLGIKTEVYMADWSTYGRAAGPIRNKQMLDEGKPDIVVAFSYDLEKSKGTANMVKQAEKAGIRVMVVGYQYEHGQKKLI